MINDHVDLEKIDIHYDCLIVGGGIVGAGILRDLSLNGAKCLLIDKKDFSSQTSSKSSKMLHGGIRYLENYDFDLVFEALKEKNFWTKNAPHLCYESPFFLPIYKDSLRPKWMICIGLFLYDVLSVFKNKHFYMTNSAETKNELPDIRLLNLTGAGVYHDAIVDDFRMTIENIIDATHSSQSLALNYVGLKSFTTFDDHICADIKDELTGKELKITAKEIVFATGPFTDNILAKQSNFTWTPKLLPSKGSHLWLKKDAIKINYPLVLTPNDGRVIFVIPQKDKILVGTTEVAINVHDSKFDLEISNEEIDYLLKNIKEFFPSSNVTRDHILESFAGLRPLVKEDSTSERGKTARNHKYYQPKHNVHVIIGGKYTTFRVMAQEVSQIIAKKLNLKYNSKKTLSPFNYKSGINIFKKTMSEDQMRIHVMQNELVRTQEDIERRLK